MRSSVSFKILPLTVLMAGLFLAGRADALTSSFPGTVWEIKTPAEVDLDAAKLALVQAEMGGNGYITRYGYQVYTWGDIVKRTTYASSCKPWFSTFLMIALDKGLTPSADAKAVNYWPCLNDINAGLGYKDRNITLRHLANQYSCYGVLEDPGAAFDYNDWQMSLFTDVVFMGIYGATASDVDQTVFNPYLGAFLRFEDNATMKHMGTGGSRFRPGHSMRDFARFGLLFLRQGTWDGTEVVSRVRAIQAVTSPLPNSLVETTAVVTEMCPGQRNFGSNTVSQGDHRGSYSWAWWVNGVDRNGNRLWPDAPFDAYIAHGSGGGGVGVFPSQQIVIVFRSSGNTITTYNRAFQLLVEAITIQDATAPTAPTGLVAGAVSGSQIDLSWTAASDADSGIGEYRVYRDEVEIAVVTGTSYSDTGLTTETSYSYTVAAMNGAGMVGPDSAPAIESTLADMTPPTIASVSASGVPTQVMITFSEPVAQAGAETPANYAIDNGLTVSAAALGANLKTVTLTTSTLSEGVTYTLTVNNVTDRAGTPNPIATDSTATFTYVADIVNGLVAHWKLDDGSGTTAADSSPSGNDATVTGAVWISGQIGGALQYANGDKVTAATPVDLAAEWTISFWFTTPLPNTGEPWHTMTRAQGEDHQVIVQSSTMELGTYLNSGGGFHSTGFKIDVLSAGWHHMAAVGSGTTTVFYIDGASVGTSLAKSTTEVYGFGAHYDGVQRFTDAIDDMRIYDRALSAAEATFLFGSGSGNQPPTALINAATTTGNPGEVLSFDGSGSFDPGGSISSYDWDFGDGNSASGAATTHAWLSGGPFTVTLTVTDNDGATAFATVQVTITGGDTTPPVIALMVMGIAGTVDDLAVGTIDINGTSFPVTAGAFSEEVSITVSPSSVTVTGTDMAGNVATRNLLVSQ